MVSTRMTFRQAVTAVADRISESDPETSAVAATAAAILVVRAVTERGVAPSAVSDALASFVAAWPTDGVECN